MEPEGSLPHSQQPATCSCPEPDQSTLRPILFKFRFNIFLPSMPISFKCTLPFWLPYRNPLCISLLPYACYIPGPFYSFIELIIYGVVSNWQNVIWQIDTNICLSTKVHGVASQKSHRTDTPCYDTLDTRLCPSQAVVADTLKFFDSGGTCASSVTCSWTIPFVSLNQNTTFRKVTVC
jgi:hypothetical protein